VRFQIVQKWANLRLSLNVQRPKVLQIQVGFALCPLIKGSALEPRWGLCPHTPVIARATALAMGPCPQLLRARTATAFMKLYIKTANNLFHVV